MHSSEIHHSTARDLTPQFGAIVEAGTPYAADEASSPSPVVGELRHVKTFDPKELPEGALLIPKDPTNPNLPRMPEVNPVNHANHETAAKIGRISVDPDAPNIIVLTGPNNEQHRLFTLRPQAQIVKWFMEHKGYRLTGNDTDHIIERPSVARHALRDGYTATPEEIVAAQTRAEQTVVTPTSSIDQSTGVTGGPAPSAEEQRHWFEPYQPAPYPETDQVVTGSHFRSIAEALADEDGRSVTAPDIEKTRSGRGFSEPGDWREAARQKHESEPEPLPLTEQLIGIDHALAAVKSLLVGKYQFTREQVETAVKEVSDTMRWHDAFPIRQFPKQGEQVKPIFHPFSWDTKMVIHAALSAVRDITPAPKDLPERIQELTSRPRQELAPDEERRLTRLQRLQRIAPVAESIRQQPTILHISEEAPDIVVEAIAAPDSGNSTFTRFLPPGWIDEPLRRSAQTPTAILKPAAPHAFRQLVQQGVNVIGRSVAKLKALRGKRRSVVNA